MERLVRISAARRVIVDDVLEGGREIPVGVADAKKVGRIDHKISLVHFGAGDSASN
jgi:pyrimidine operon attenuation protein/uracil phosphoribosyltransferase